MAQGAERERRQSLREEMEEIQRSMRSSFSLNSHGSRRLSRAFSARDRDHDEEYELQWAALERLPTVDRLKSTLFVLPNGEGGERGTGKRELVDVTKLGALEKRLFIDNMIKHIEEDNLRLLQKQKDRMERVNVKLPTIEVKYKDLLVEAECEVVEGKPLPTLWNTAKSIFLNSVRLPWKKTQRAKITILDDISGVIKPSRMTLLLGPPGCGKTTFLLALSGKLDKSLKASGEVSYNGLRLEEFVPAKTSAYISQYDLHIPEMTVRETLDFSARFQGIGIREEIMKEVSRREKEAGIVPDSEIDTYMKAISVEGLERSLQTDYILKIMGLDICAETMVGDAMRRGISGGQKKRLTTGEMIVGPTKALFMDEISTGLDSSTTFQIVKWLQQLAHITEATLLVSLLQPAPETYNLFDDIILMAEGKIAYHGPRDRILGFFEECGFKCPDRKGAADFLQEVLSKKDQGQYWIHTEKPWSYIPVDYFSKKFKSHEIGKGQQEMVSETYKNSERDKNALSFSAYSLTQWDLFKACVSREYLLMRRNSFVYIFKTTQLIVIAIITMTLFLRTRMTVDIIDANYYMGSLFFSLILLMVNGFPEISMTISRLPVFFKQRDFYFYPAWAYAIPASVLKLPLSIIESFIWTAITYYVIGYSPEAGRFFCQFLLLCCVHQMSISLFRFIAALTQTASAGITSGILMLLIMFLFGGFILPKPSLPGWLEWGFWLSPLTYAEIAISINEFLAPRWEKLSPAGIPIGKQLLTTRGLDYQSHFFWISVGALIGFSILFNAGFSLALTFLKSPGRSRPFISLEKLSELKAQGNQITEEDQSYEKTISTQQDINEHTRTGVAEKMVLPFEPLTVTFQNLQYYVETPQEMKEQGYTEKRLQLLHDITGVFRPGVLTALMGISGAGKTTLMDVLCGRKTTGYIEGDIRIGGYPKVQRTFARISGYCEQTDIHSPQITVEESLVYSAWLRLSPDIDPKIKAAFVNEVLETIELDKIKDAIVGMAGVNGLSTEQRKRLTIAVELVSNPSIIFMDEPTSGLDARAAAIVMRSVKNISETGRTVVCTIHQPSIDVFEAFDELILMKRGGSLIYTGHLGQHSKNVIKYFEGIPGVPKIKDNYNPATWMLEVTSASLEMKLGVDFSEIYRQSSAYKINLDLVEQHSTPPQGSKELYFPTTFSQNFWGQFRACLWKQYLSYWRSPQYNNVRLIFITFLSVIMAATFWQRGRTLNNQQDLFNMLGSMFLCVIFLGIINCSSVLPFIAVERNVLYRETFAGMYSSWAYALAQMAIELPYVFLQTLVFMGIAYTGIGYFWSPSKFFWFFYIMFCTLLLFNYLGMLIVSLTPNVQVASILASAFYGMMNLFSGFILPGPKIPMWWIWFYRIIPTSWTLNGLFISQYGDIDKEITVFGESKAVGSFISDYFGFHKSQLPLVAVLLFLYPLLIGSLFSICIGKVNFQKR